jgi:hypothetical protein
MFNVYVFQTEEDDRDEMLLRYNIGGIHLAPSAFVKLQQEISLERRELPLEILGETEPVTLYAGLVPIASDTFHKIIVREGRASTVDARTLVRKPSDGPRYYEVCTTAPVYGLFEAPKAESAALNR